MYFRHHLGEIIVWNEAKIFGRIWSVGSGWDRKVPWISGIAKVFVWFGIIRQFMNGIILDRIDIHWLT